MKKSDPLAGVLVFLALAETLNFGRAAAQLGLSRATASAQIGDLEERLGVRLFQRSTRHVALTEAGVAYRDALGGLASQARQAAEIATSYQQEAVGRLRLTAPEPLYEDYIAPALADFLSSQPGLTFDIEITSRRVDLIREGFDLAIRASLAVEPTLITRRLGTSSVSLTASPGYLSAHGTPEAPEDLPAHQAVHHSGLKAGTLLTLKRKGEERRVPVAPHVWIDSGPALCDAAIRGLGITYLPEFITGAALREGRLVRVLEDWSIQPVDVNAVYPSNRLITPKVRRFVGLLARRFDGHPDFRPA